MATKELIALRMAPEIRKSLTLKARQHHRSITNQIEEYVRIGMLAEENPDLSYEFVKNTLEAIEEEKEGLLVSYKPAK